MPNPIVLEILENERNTITKAINILKYGGTGQKRRGRPPNVVRAMQAASTNGDGHGKKLRRMTEAGRKAQLRGLKQYWKKRRAAEK